VTSFSFIDYDEVVTSDEGFWKWLYCLNDKGHCIMNGVPTDTKHTTLICEKISHIQKTIYDEYSDVETMDNPINIAYTNTGLDFHIDLVYYQSPPGLLMLHCYRNDRVVEGGLSILVDGLAVANDMRETHPKQFDVLTKIPATFKKIHYERDNPVHMIRNQPHIILDRNGRIIRLNWAPLFEGTLSIPENKLEDYYDAYCTFHKCLSESPHRLTHRLEPGQMLSFNNLRMFHGRTRIETNGGKRHFKGFYVNIDEFVSKLNILSNQLNKKEPIKHVLNGSHYL
jgi:gamma-butyrobetaine dioxygenase